VNIAHVQVLIYFTWSIYILYVGVIGIGIGMVLFGVILVLIYVTTKDNLWGYGCCYIVLMLLSGVAQYSEWPAFVVITQRIPASTRHRRWHVGSYCSVSTSRTSTMEIKLGFFVTLDTSLMTVRHLIRTRRWSPASLTKCGIRHSPIARV